MPDIKVSVGLVTYQRAHLLRRSLECYARQSFPAEEFELIVVDDGSTDGTKALCEEYAGRLQIVYIPLDRPEGLVWRDCGANLNVALRAARGDLILLTHPEVMVGRRSIAAMYEARSDKRYVCCKPYYLTVGDQEQVDIVNWKKDGPIAVRKIPRFYQHGKSSEWNGNRDYLAQNIDRTDCWESWVIGGLTRTTWHAIGGMAITQSWGLVDVLFKWRRDTLGIQNVTMLKNETFCVHQNHDTGLDVLTPRNEEVWRQEMQDWLQANGANPMCTNLGEGPTASDYLVTA